MTSRARLDAIPVLEVLADHGCRFVVIGSTARSLAGEVVVPADLDIVVDACPRRRPRLVAALVALDATIERRSGQRPVGEALHLPWAWGWRAETDHGSIDVITRMIDGTDIETHDALATDVEVTPELTVRCHPTRHQP